MIKKNNTFHDSCDDCAKVTLVPIQKIEINILRHQTNIDFVVPSPTILATMAVARSNLTWQIADGLIATFLNLIQLADSPNVAGCFFDCQILCYWEDRHEEMISLSERECSDLNWDRHMLAQRIRDSVISAIDGIENDETFGHTEPDLEMKQFLQDFLLTHEIDN